MKDTQPTWKAKVLLCLALSWTITIIYLSLANIGKIKIIKINASDKIYHAGSYFVLALLWLMYAYYKQANSVKSNNIGIVIVLIVFGIIIEAFQFVLTSYRTFDLWDAFANAIGVFMASLIFNYVIKYLFKK